jgi:uncharacterized membrane protein
MHILYLYLITLPLLLALDLAWVGGVAKNYYKEQLGSLFSSTPVWWAIIAWYLLYVGALVYFAILPGLAQHSILRTAFNGAFLGLVAYGTYDLINAGLTAGWPIQMSLVDMVWGVVLSAVVSALAVLIATKVFGL